MKLKLKKKKLILALKPKKLKIKLKQAEVIDADEQRKANGILLLEELDRKMIYEVVYADDPRNGNQDVVWLSGKKIQKRWKTLPRFGEDHKPNMMGARKVEINNKEFIIVIPFKPITEIWPNGRNEPYEKRLKRLRAMYKERPKTKRLAAHFSLTRRQDLQPLREGRSKVDLKFTVYPKSVVREDLYEAAKDILKKYPDTFINHVSYDNVSVGEKDEADLGVQRKRFISSKLEELNLLRSRKKYKQIHEYEMGKDKLTIHWDDKKSEWKPKWKSHALKLTFKKKVKLKLKPKGESFEDQ